MTDPKNMSTGRGWSLSMLLQILAAVLGVGVLLFPSIASAAAPEGSFSPSTKYIDGQPVTVVTIGNKCAIETVIRAYGPAYEAKTGQPLTWQTLYFYDGNKDSMIPICDAPADGRKFVGRGELGESVWRPQNCPADKHRVVFVAGESVKIPSIVIETYEQMQARLKAQDVCFKSADCLKERIVKLGGTVPEIPVTTPPATTAPSTASPPPTATPAPVAPAPAEQTVVVHDQSVLPWILVLVLTFVSIAGIIYVSRLKKAHAVELAEQKRIANVDYEELRKDLEAQAAKLTQRAENAANELRRSEEKIRTLTGPFDWHAEAVRLQALTELQQSTLAEHERNKLALEKEPHSQRLTHAQQTLLECAMKLGYVLPVQGTLSESISHVFTQIVADRKAAKETADKVERLEKMEAKAKADVVRLASLHQSLTLLDPQLIANDNEVTELKRRLAEIKTALKDRDDLADDLRAKITSGGQEIEDRLQELAAARIPIADQLAALRPEFEELHRRLTGFELNRDKLYQEAQDDRNAAAAEMGLATQLMEHAKTMRGYVERAETQLREKRSKVDEDLRAMAARTDELARHETDVALREACVGGLLADLIVAAGLPPETTLTDIQNMHEGIFGLIGEATTNAARATERARLATADLEAERTAHAETQGALTKLQGDNAELTARVEELEREPHLTISGLRESQLPPPPADLFKMVGSEQSQEASHGGSHQGGNGESPDRKRVNALRAAVLGLTKDDVVEIANAAELTAWIRLLNVQRFVADPDRLCAHRGHVPQKVRDLVQNEVVLNRLAQLRLADLPWWSEIFQTYMASPSPFGQTLVPAAGAAPPAQGSRSPGSKPPPPN